MKTSLLTTVATTALLAALSLPAHANGKPTSNVPNVVAQQRVDAPQSWTGIVVGIHGGHSNANVELGIPMGPASLDSLTASGPLAGGTLGVRLHVPNTALVIGARGGYQWYFGDFEIAGGGASLFKAGIKDAWFVDGTAGLAYGSALFYAGLGWTQARTEASFMGTSIANTPDLKGHRAIVGIETALPRSMAGYFTPTVSLEYTATFYNDLSFAGGFVTADVTEHAVVGRLNFQIGK